MIDEEITYREKGYRSTDLSRGSHKPVWRICDGCGEGRWIEFRFHKRLCNNCACKTDEWREKQRISHEGKHDGDKNGMYGKKHTPKTCAQISKSLDGKIHTEDAKRNMSRAQKGKVLSDETKALMSKSKMGHEVSERTREKLRKANVGKTHTDESKLKMSISRTGKYPSDEARRNMSAAQQGISIDDWEGFTSFGKYCEKFNNAFKESVRDRFGRLCFMCYKTEDKNGRKLDVHHVDYDKDCICNDNIGYEFVPLCMKCHRMTNGDRDLWELLIMNVLLYEGWI